MKKLICAIVVMLFASQALAVEVDLTKDGKMREWIGQTGTKILNANKIENPVVFVYKDGKTINAYANIGPLSPRTVNVYRGLISYVDSDDELAAILAHEISHSQDSYIGILRGSYAWVPCFFSSKRYEYKADKRGVDYMVQAGYNPLAMIVILHKFAGQFRFDVLGTHPLTSRRVAVLYEYIYKKYPSFLADNAYKNNIYYQNFLLTSTQNRMMFQEKVKTNSKKRLRYR